MILDSEERNLKIAEIENLKKRRVEIAKKEFRCVCEPFKLFEKLKILPDYMESIESIPQIEMLKFLFGIAIYDEDISIKDTNFMNSIFDLNFSAEQYIDIARKGDFFKSLEKQMVSPLGVKVINRFLIRQTDASEDVMDFLWNYCDTFSSIGECMTSFVYDDDEEEINVHINNYVAELQKISLDDFKELCQNENIDNSFFQEVSSNEVKENKNYDNAVIYIETEKASGSGFIVTPSGGAITCYHVIENSDEIFAKVHVENSDYLVKAEIIAYDKILDIALLQLEKKDYSYIYMGIDDPLIPGTEIMILGYPFGKKMNDNIWTLNASYYKGYISSNQKINGLDITLLDISAKAGNSGSPVINLESGKVIGILCGSILGGKDNREEINYMRPISKRYLENDLWR